MSGIIEQARYTCAIGALQSVVAIPKAVPILHAGPGCGDMIQGFFERSTGYAGFTGGLRVIEDIYHNVLATYK